MSELTTRLAEVQDAPQLANLSAELGYPVEAGLMRSRLEQFVTMPGHAIYVACLNHQIVGWIDVGIVHHLQSGAQGEIGGLIVADGKRGLGIGRTLVREAEKWASEQGLQTLVVRSQIKREEAHRFYLGLAYERVKTSAVFRKILVDRDQL
jgi:ribosomal protein S18 acetylase RimI-like enzyme